MILYYPLSSFLTLFANILHNPQDPHVTSDLELMTFVANFLAPMVTDASPFTISASIQLLRELEKVAMRLVEKKNTQVMEWERPILPDHSGRELAYGLDHHTNPILRTVQSFSTPYARPEAHNLMVYTSFEDSHSLIK